jgi:segregation and condensation protein B
MQMFDNEINEGEIIENEDQAPTASEEASENTAEFIDSFRLLSIIESLLFASDKPMSLAMLKQAFAGTSVDTKTLKKALEELQVICADPTRGVTLDEVTGGWQFRTKLDNIDFLKKISKARPFRLSGPALEVLSIIAYKQPLIKNEVDQIRGVESGHLVRALMEKGLVSFDGKTELPGKPMAYSTTRKFLEIFGLRNLHELPTLSAIDDLLPEGIGEEEEKETLSSVTEMMSQAIASSYSEGEEELSEISEKICAIDTSSEFFEQEKLRQKQKREREKAEDIREALAMGEKVEKRDVKWLERYEAQLAAPTEAVAPADGATPLEALEASQDEVTEVSESDEEIQMAPPEEQPPEENLDV